VSAAPAGQSANLIGALALAVSDRVADAVADRSGRSESTAAALSALDQFLGQPSIDLLSRVLGLSQSGTVRLVDRLEDEGLVRRGPGEDGRTTTVPLTPAGRRAARQLEAARLEVLDAVLEPLSDSEQRTLSALVGRMLVGMMREPGATRWMCRLCDLSACGRPDGHCPIEREARARYG
jgi:DNA-binding MarR family transcriptional regulator